MEPTPEHVKIDAIKVNLNGLTVELTIEQARSLWKQLDELFGPRPAAPVWIWPYTPSFVKDPTQSYIGDPFPGGGLCGGTSIMVNPNDEPFPEKWQVSYGAVSGNVLSINI